jgi:hypothetical protein
MKENSSVTEKREPHGRKTREEGKVASLNVVKRAVGITPWGAFGVSEVRAVHQPLTGTLITPLWKAPSQKSPRRRADAPTAVEPHGGE